MMIVMPIALVTWVLTDALRQMRQINTTALAKTVERGTQSEFNLVNQITVPTNVYCSPGGECHHTSRKCEGLKNVPMDAIRRGRSCVAYSETDNEVENIVKDGLENNEVDCTWPSHLFCMEQCGAALWLPIAAAHRLIARNPLREAAMRSGRLSTVIAGGSDEVGRASAKQVHMTWVEDATINEDKQCLQRDVTEVDVSRRGAGRKNMLDVCCDPTFYDEYSAMVKAGNECQLTVYMSLHGNICYGGLLRGSVVPARFLHVSLNTLRAEHETSNALVVVWSGERSTPSITDRDRCTD